MVLHLEQKMGCKVFFPHQWEICDSRIQQQENQQQTCGWQCIRAMLTASPFFMGAKPLICM